MNPPNHIPLSKIPPEVFAAAETLDHYFTKQGLRYWEYAAVADRRLVNKLENELAAAHAVLDADPSMIIRNAKDGYPEGREPRELTLAERVQSLCRYAADWKRWFEQADREIETLKGARPLNIPNTPLCRKMKRLWLWRGFLSFFGLYRRDPDKEWREIQALVDDAIKHQQPKL